ncbi:MAG: TlpA family protein disulfide reductase [Anaerolineales bacterium]
MSETETTTRNPGLLLFLIFPLVGMIGLAVVLLNSGDDPPTDDTRAAIPREDDQPTPAPIQVEPLRPTVTTRPIMNNTPPDIPVTSMAGEDFTLIERAGQPLVVNFWATWCPPCVREMPTLESFAADHPEVQVLAVTDPNDGQSMADIRDFIDEFGLEDMQITLDAGGRLRVNFLAVQLPMTFVIDAEGIVRYRHIGEVTRDDLDFYLAAVTE